jgi:beta-glucosidase
MRKKQADKGLRRRSSSTAADAGARGGGKPAQDSEGFPRGFWWGSATAAYQLEGGAHEDGRKPSIWDTFSHTPGKTENGDTGDVACDHYHRYAEDVQLMADLGVKHYRFSLAWPRIIPDGRGAVNAKGVDFYKRLADCLLRHGITPHATLYHWDLPQALQDRYAGWQSREIVNDFGAYAAAVGKHLGDHIKDWITLNEIASFARFCGYGVNQPGPHAPGISLKTTKDHVQITHHALLAHGIACQALRAASPRPCTVGAAENYTPFVPAIETPENMAAVHRAFVRDACNGGIIVPMLTGRYNDLWLADLGAEAPDIQAGDLALIHQPLDSLGFNCYSGSYVLAADTPKGYTVLPFFDAYPKGSMPWLNIVPESIYWGIRLLTDVLGRKDLPVYISENGCADGAKPDAMGEVADIDRVMYLRGYLRNVHRAITEGYPVIGYFPWSLMDNFEWGCGYAKRFGMIRVDYATQKRTPKLSYRWYQQVIRSNRVV